MGPRAGLQALEKKNFLSLPETQTRLPHSPARNLRIPDATDYILLPKISMLFPALVSTNKLKKTAQGKRIISSFYTDAWKIKLERSELVT